MKYTLMKLVRDLKPSFPSRDGCVLTLGNFDGVHIGHQALLTALRQESKRLQLPMVVVIFEPQPEEFFSKADAPARLTSLRDKLRFLAQYDVDIVHCLHFSSKLAMFSAVDFAEEIFALGAKFILVGEDCKFGYQRQGDSHLLTQLAGTHACQVQVFPKLAQHGVRVSSTLIRKKLSQGDLTGAVELLGRPYSVLGRVVRGFGRGSQVGVPTANLLLNYPRPPLAGVYAIQAVLPDKRICKGIANWGVRPTIGGMHFCLEVHIFGLEENLYGKYLEVCFLKKIRSEKRFESMEILVKQIHQDIQKAQDFFKGLTYDKL